MTDDDSQMVSFSVTGVELVHGRGDLVGLAIVELNVSGVAMTLQGFQIRRAGPDRITVGLPAFKHPRDGQMRTAIVLPCELSNAISSTVAATFNSLARPTLSDAGTRGATALVHT